MSYQKQVRIYLDNARDCFQWGILTNGQEWRLYSYRAKRDEYFSLRLPHALKNIDNFKLFLALFGRGAFIPDTQGRTRLDNLRERSESHQSELESNLQQRVYTLAEWIAQGFYNNESNRRPHLTPDDVFNVALILLYRLMFILYAEARGLLPVSEGRKGARTYQRDFSLQRFRPWLENTHYSPEDDALDKYWNELVSLFEIIDGTNEKACRRLNIPRYNGGLFDTRRHPELSSWRLGDWTVQETLKRLMFNIIPSTAVETIPIASAETIDYSSLSVQQLGSIYEGLLEFKPVLKPNGRIAVEPVSEERWRTGSYYTPGWVVDYILEETLRPILDSIEHSEAVQNAIAQGLKDNSFAGAVLKLRILDPAWAAVIS